MYTRIEDLFWRDEKLKKCSIEARHLFLYLLSNPHRNILGFYYLPKAYAMFDLGMVEEGFDKGLGELLNEGLIKHDEASNIVFVKRFLKYNKLENSNQVTSAVKKISELPDTKLFEDLLEVLLELKVVKYLPLIEAVKDRVSLDFLKGFERVPKQEKETEEETEKETVSVTEKETEKEEESGKPDDPSDDETVVLASGDSEEACKFGETVKEIVDYLNSIAGTNYRNSSSKTRSCIKARLNEGFVLDDFKIVISKKAAEWIGSKMEMYMRPETLFGNKFESYLNQPGSSGGGSFQDAINDFLEGEGGIV